MSTEFVNYKKLKYKEKRSLYKEFNKVFPENKMWRAILIISSFFGIIGFILGSIYFINFGFLWRNLMLRYLGYLFFGVYVFVSGMYNYKVDLKRDKEFCLWLIKTKNILYSKKYLRVIEDESMDDDTNV